MSYWPGAIRAGPRWAPARVCQSVTTGYPAARTSKSSPTIRSGICVPPRTIVTVSADRLAGQGEEAGGHDRLARAGVPVPADDRIAGPGGRAAERGQRMLPGQPGHADQVVGFGHVAAGARLGGQCRLDSPLLGGAEDERVLRVPVDLHRLGGRARQAAHYPVQRAAQADREGHHSRPEEHGDQRDRGAGRAGERGRQPDRHRPGQPEPPEQPVRGVAAARPGARPRRWPAPR